MTDWNEHRRALTEAQAWTMAHLDVNNPAQCLRSPELGACLTDYPDEWFYNLQNMQEIQALIHKRQEILADARAVEAPAGRILCAFYGWDTQMGEGTPASEGVIDDAYLPPWDMWFAVIELPETNSTEQYVLLAWIPESLIHLVQSAIEVAATQPIAWLSHAADGRWPELIGYSAFHVPPETRAILQQIAQQLNLA